MSDEDAIRAVEQLIEMFEEAIEQTGRSLLRTKEALQLDVEMKRRLYATLPVDSAAYRTFERLSKAEPFWITSTPSGYVAPKDQGYLAKRLAILRAVADQFGPEPLRQAGAEKHQYHVVAGDHGRARRLIFDLMSRAKSDLGIVDPYADETIFPFVESLDPSVVVQVLAGSKPKAVLKTITGGYQASGRKLDMRKTAAFHDRYLIIDGAEVWSLGASINHAGKSAFTISRVSDDAARNKIVADFAAAWSSGAPL
jgi:hypothetical protein